MGIGVCFDLLYVPLSLIWNNTCQPFPAPTVPPADLITDPPMLSPGPGLGQRLQETKTNWAELYPRASLSSSLAVPPEHLPPQHSTTVHAPSHQQQKPVSRNSLVLPEGGQDGQNQAPKDNQEPRGEGRRKLRKRLVLDCVEARLGRCQMG